jgi:hypothetical protein
LFDVNLSQTIPTDIGDSLVKLDPSNNLTVVDFYAPYDALNYQNGTKIGLCKNDEDFGSGGVLLVPPPFQYNGLNVTITADKQSNLYVADQGDLGKFSAGTVCTNNLNNIQCITTPHPKVDTSQGYWASPAYWHYNDGQDHYMLYYSATTDKAPLGTPPLPINGYSLQPNGASGPISDPPTASTATLFCPKSPTPSVSSNPTSAASGIVWAIEHGNAHNPGPPLDCDGTAKQAALHAFNATNLAKLYDSRGLTGGTTGSVTNFSTPTIFQGRVYVGTQTSVNVFGLCNSQQSGCLH